VRERELWSEREGGGKRDRGRERGVRRVKREN